MVIKKTDSHPKVNFGKNAVLLINLGTPDSTSKKDIKKYLKEFLSDNRIIEINKYLWWFILNVIILNVRPAKTAKTYKEIWMHEVNQSPLRYYTIQQKKLLSKKISNKNVIVDYAMRYGEPSIKKKILDLKNRGCENIVILPMYPQYSSATIGSVCDSVFKTLIKMRWQPSIQIIPHYESHSLSWNTKDVKEVANYITIGENDLIDYVKDTRISLELRAKMLTDKEVSEVNFSVTTENRILYLVGIAQDDKELNKVIEHASNIAGVKKIVNLIKLKDL